MRLYDASSKTTSIFFEDLSDAEKWIDITIKEYREKGFKITDHYLECENGRFSGVLRIKAA